MTTQNKLVRGHRSKALRSQIGEQIGYYDYAAPGTSSSVAMSMVERKAADHIKNQIRKEALLRRKLEAEVASLRSTIHEIAESVRKQTA